MRKEHLEQVSEEIKREASQIDKDLGHAVTYRMLYFRAFTWLSMRVQDNMIGVASMAQVHRTYCILTDLMPQHAHRIKNITAVASPQDNVPRWSELER